MLDNLFLALLVIGAVMLSLGFAEALRTSGKGLSFVLILLGLTITVLGALLRTTAV